jgi:hypothetical protein
MPGKVTLYTMVVVTVLAGLLLAAIHGHAPHKLSDWLAPVGPAVTVAGILLWLWDRWVWRWPWVNKLAGRPNLHGTWHGDLVSDWVDRTTGTRIPPDPNVFLVVRQRYWRIAARLLTKESSSASAIANFEVAPDGVQQLRWVYMNTPRPEVRHRSDLHYGTAVLTAPRDPKGLQGEYFTDRKTGGELRFHTRYKELIETHADGMALLGL